MGVSQFDNFSNPIYLSLLLMALCHAHKVYKFQGNYSSLVTRPVGQLLSTSRKEQLRKNMENGSMLKTLEVTVKKICTTHFKKAKTKIQPKALSCLSHIMNIAIVECALRSGKQAYAEDSRTVTLDIVQKILPQLIMDL